MVKILRLVSFISVVVILGGCDTFYGPKFRNGYSQNIAVFVTYENGQQHSALWPPCRTTYLGQENVEIKEIIVERSGELTHRLGKDEIKKLLERESREPGNSVWNLDSSGVRLVTGRDCKVVEYA